ncbi:glycosyltransferase [Algiphilus sp.]|uniref:glycosyltransferase n=1 Tax=Algiphilus sp. TaxID=1872431 RepID=UPI00343ECF98
MTVTFESPRSLSTLLQQLRTQGVDRIIVVDNSLDPIALQQNRRNCESASAVHIVCNRNLGPAGAYAIGLANALGTNCKYILAIDDDCLLPTSFIDEARRAVQEDCILHPAVVETTDGQRLSYHGWVGVVIPRTAIVKMGLPIWDLIWWTEDTEYIYWRLPQGGYPLRRFGTEVVRVHKKRAAGRPAWKYYYEARNTVYFRLHVQAMNKLLIRPRHRRRYVRAFRALRSTLKLLFLAIGSGPGRYSKCQAVVRGTWDGLWGQLGARYPIEGGDRPVVME